MRRLWGGLGTAVPAGVPMTRVRILPSDRPTALGASELGAIAGLNPWRTPLDVWLSKVGDSVEFEPSESQQLGLDLEGFLVHAAGGKRNSITKSHPGWPVVRMFATPDGIADHGRTLVEAKSVTSRFVDWADGAIPDYYIAQGYGQLACYPDAQQVLFSVLVGGRPERRTLKRDDDAIDELVEAAMRWWATYVVPGIVPPPVTDDDRWTIARRNADTSARMTRVASADEEAAAGDLLALRERIAELETHEQATRLRLAELATGADIAGTGWKATWSTRVTRDYRAAWIERTGSATVPDGHVLTHPVFTVRSTKEKE